MDGWRAYERDDRAPQCPHGAPARGRVAAARRTGAFVAFTTIVFAEDEIDRVVWLQKMPALRTLLAGTPWVELDERLDRTSGEPLVAKKAASAFSGTDLADILRQAGVGTVIVCGATTSGCIRATAIDACSLGWPTFVPREAVGDRSAGPHEANLLDIDAKYADVVTIDEALAMLTEAAR